MKASQVSLIAGMGLLVSFGAKALTVAVERLPKIQVYSVDEKIIQSGYGWADRLPVACLEQDEYQRITINFDLCKHVVVDGKIQEDADQPAINAANYAKAALDYFWNDHGRNSLDGRGSDIVIVLHNGLGVPRWKDSAMWDEQNQILVYGTGDGVETGDFTQAPEVAGHEFTHAIVNHTCRLDLAGEAGSIDEALADFFGIIITNNDKWTMARNAFLTNITKKFARNLAFPAAGFKRIFSDDESFISVVYPSHVRDKWTGNAGCIGSDDFCARRGRHLNSTIPGHAFYLIHQAIGREKSAKLLYAVMTEFLSADSGFKDLSRLSMRACLEMFGEGETCDAVGESYALVGL